MTRTLNYTGTLVVTSCWCGIGMAIPRDLFNEATRKEKSVYCPLGHSFVYGNTTEEQLRQAKNEAARARQREQAVRDLLTAEEHSHRATKGHVTRARKKLERVKAGVCPCCNRSFQNLARHMEGQHPDWVPTK